MVVYSRIILANPQFAGGAGNLGIVLEDEVVYESDVNTLLSLDLYIVERDVLDVTLRAANQEDSVAFANIRCLHVLKQDAVVGWGRGVQSSGVSLVYCWVTAIFLIVYYFSVEKRPSLKFKYTKTITSTDISHTLYGDIIPKLPRI